MICMPKRFFIKRCKSNAVELHIMYNSLRHDSETRGTNTLLEFSKAQPIFVPGKGGKMIYRL